MHPSQYVQHRDIEATHWWFRGRREILRATLAGLRLGPRRVLDLGCGVGANLALLGGLYPSARIVGIDLEPSALRFCRLGSGASLCQSDAARLPFASGSFDLVAALDALEHMRDDEATLRELHRVCAPGGSLLLTVPAFPALWGNVDEQGHHHRRYRRAELTRRVEGAGFSLRLVRFFNFLLFPPIAAVRLLSRALPRLGQAAAGASRSDFDVVRSGPLNELLARLFALEAPLLRLGPPFGVSLLCVAAREG
ncbi:MAG: class I SAM-dependent methyltransferase [Myxococcota bacterium]|nr:class I SAM-dependent methyltransferase [Myxococcota bacterium]